jgi:hypothetical protein
MNYFVHSNPLFWDSKKYLYLKNNLTLQKIAFALRIISLLGVVFSMVQFLNLNNWYWLVFAPIFASIIWLFFRNDWQNLQKKPFDIARHDSLVNQYWDYHHQDQVYIFVHNLSADLDMVRRCLLSITKLKYTNYEVVVLDETNSSRIWTICNIFEFKYQAIAQGEFEKHLKTCPSNYLCVIDTQIALHQNYLRETVPYLKKNHQIKTNIATSQENSSSIFRGYSSANEDEVGFLDTCIYNSIFHKSILSKAGLEITKKIKTKKLDVALCFGQCSYNILNYLEQNRDYLKISKINIFTWLIIYLSIITTFGLCFYTKTFPITITILCLPYILLTILIQTFFKNNKHSLENMLLGGIHFYYICYSLISSQIKHFVYFVNGIGVVLTAWLYILALQGTMFKGLTSFLPSLGILSVYAINLIIIIFINYNLANIFNQYEFKEFDTKILNWKKRYHHRKKLLSSSQN